jgi:antirestriction protein ArdC
MKDLYERVTNSIIVSLEAGVRPWHRPWSGEHAAGRIARPLRASGVPYRGINILMLWAEALEQGYTAPVWMTFKQALQLKANVRKGEKGTLVVYADAVTRKESDDRGEHIERRIPFLKSYTVFNVAQIENLPAAFYAQPEPRSEPLKRIARAEAFVGASGADIRHAGNQAFYSPSRDIVQMPPLEAFESAESYYAVLIHELTHWTKHPSRLARDLGRKRWGDAGYAMEELVAELGAAFVLADLDLTPQQFGDGSRSDGSELSQRLHTLPCAGFQPLRDELSLLMVAAVGKVATGLFECNI